VAQGIAGPRFFEIGVITLTMDLRASRYQSNQGRCKALGTLQRARARRFQLIARNLAASVLYVVICFRET